MCILCCKYARKMRYDSFCLGNWNSASLKHFNWILIWRKFSPLFEQKWHSDKFWSYFKSIASNRVSLGCLTAEKFVLRFWVTTFTLLYICMYSERNINLNLVQTLKVFHWRKKILYQVCETWLESLFWPQIFLILSDLLANVIRLEIT